MTLRRPLDQLANNWGNRNRLSTVPAPQPCQQAPKARRRQDARRVLALGHGRHPSAARAGADILQRDGESSLATALPERERRTLFVTALQVPGRAGCREFAQNAGVPFFASLGKPRSTGTMSVQFDTPTMPCRVCAAEVIELRRGRCWGCYTRWAESRPVGRGAVCTICQEKRRDQLKLIEILARTLPFCHSCAARTMRIDPLPETLDDIRVALRRERREADRRVGAAAHRIFP